MPRKGPGPNGSSYRSCLWLPLVTVWSTRYCGAEALLASGSCRRTRGSKEKTGNDPVVTAEACSDNVKPTLEVRPAGRRATYRSGGGAGSAAPPGLAGSHNPPAP